MKNKDASLKEAHENLLAAQRQFDQLVGHEQEFDMGMWRDPREISPELRQAISHWQAITTWYESFDEAVLIVQWPKGAPIFEGAPSE